MVAPKNITCVATACNRCNFASVKGKKATGTDKTRAEQAHKIIIKLFIQSESGYLIGQV